MNHIVLLTLQVLVLIAAIQAGTHAWSWLWKVTPDNPLRPLLFGTVLFACGAIIWDMVIIAHGAHHSAVPPPLAALIDILFFTALWMKVISSWLIDYEFDLKRVVRCLLSQMFGALATALVLAGISNL